MTIKNIGTKIVHIGTTMLMPEDTMPADKAVCEAPVIKAMVKRGLLSISEDAKAPKADAKKGDGKKTTDDGKKATDDGKTADDGKKTTDDGKTADGDK